MEIASAVAVGCSVESAHDVRRPCDNGSPAWPMLGQGQQRDSRLPFPGPSFPFQERAKFRPVGQIVGTPIIGEGGRVILHTSLGFLYVLQADIASVERVVNMGVPQKQCALLVPHLPAVLACYNDTTLTAFSVNNGSLLWQFTDTNPSWGGIIDIMPLRNQGPKVIMAREYAFIQVISAVDGQLLISQRPTSMTACPDWLQLFRQSPVEADLYMGRCKVRSALPTGPSLDPLHRLE